MDILHIKANGTYYYPTEPGEEPYEKFQGRYAPVCRIKKLMFGRWQIDYYDEWIPDERGYYTGDNQVPNARLILYPSGIEEIKYRVDQKY